MTPKGYGAERGNNSGLRARRHYHAQRNIVQRYSVDPNTGSAFAILDVPSGNAIEFAYVDDFLSILNILRLSK